MTWCDMRPFPFLASFLSTNLRSRHAQLLTVPQKCRALSKLCTFVHVVPSAWNTLDPLSSWLNTICPPRLISGKTAMNFLSPIKCPFCTATLTVLNSIKSTSCLMLGSVFSCLSSLPLYYLYYKGLPQCLIYGKYPVFIQ